MNKKIETLAAAAFFVMCASQAFAREEYSRNFDKTVPLAAGQRVRIQHRLGDVSIRTQSKPEVVVHAIIRCSAPDSADAKRFADDIRVDVQPSGSGLLIETLYPKWDSGGFFGLRNISYSVSLDITMPAASPLELKNSFGAVSVTDLKANGDIATSHGNLIFRNGSGTQRLENQFSSVEVAGNSGDVTLLNANGRVDVSDVSGTVNIRNRFGKVTVSRVKGNLIVNDQNGEVEANDVGGSAELNTSFAPVQFSGIGGQLSVRAQNSNVKGRKIGGAASVTTSFGSTDISGIRKGAKVVSQNGAVTVTEVGEDLSVRTSFAPVHGDRIGGGVSVENQNGVIDIAVTSHQGCRPVTLRTSFGPVRVHVPSDASYAVTAKTSFGRIHSDFPVLMEGSLGGDSLNGKIGAGSCTMQITDQNGTIDILRGQ